MANFGNSVLTSCTWRSQTSSERNICARKHSVARHVNNSHDKLTITEFTVWTKTHANARIDCLECYRIATFNLLWTLSKDMKDLSSQRAQSSRFFMILLVSLRDAPSTHWGLTFGCLRVSLCKYTNMIPPTLPPYHEQSCGKKSFIEQTTKIFLPEILSILELMRSQDKTSWDPPSFD